MTYKRPRIGRSVRSTWRSARNYYLSSDSWVVHAVVLSLLIMLGWALVLADLSGIMSLDRVLRAGFFYVITYGYVSLLWLGASLSVVVLAVEWHGIRALHHIDEENLSSLEKKHPYLPSRRIIVFIILLLLSLPAFLFTAIRQSNAALALEEEPYVYEEARSWQIANDDVGVQDFSTWGRTAAITISGAVIDADLTDFTVILTEDILPAEMFDADGTYPALNGGGDIRFTSDAAGLYRLAVDIRTFTTNNDPALGTADIAVKVPFISASTGGLLYVWYNKEGETQPAASDTYGQYHAYDSSYKTVWSMNENPAGSAPQMQNRISDAYHGSSVGGMTSGDSVGGNAGNAIDLDGTDDYLSIPTPTVLNNQDFSVEFLVYPGTQNAAITSVIDYSHSYTGGPPRYGSWVIQSEDATSNRYYYLGYNAGNNTTANFQPIADLGAGKGMQWTTGAWQHVAYTKTGVTIRGYKNGTTAWSPAAPSTGNVYYNAALSLDIGTAVGFEVARSFGGILDEIRISSGTRSAAWVKAVAENLMNPATFAGAGTPSNSSGDGPTVTGRAFSDEGVTPLASTVVSLSVSGSSLLDSVTTDANGWFTLSGSALRAGEVVTVFLNNDAAPRGAIVTIGSGSSMTGVSLYQNHLIIRDELGGTVTNAMLDEADNSADADLLAVFSVAGGTLTTQQGMHLLLGSGTTFAPGGNITAGGSFDVAAGVFEAGTHTVILTSTLHSQLSTLNSLHNLTLNNGLVGYWKLDDGSGSLIARDDSGNGNHGTWNGASAGANRKPQWKTDTAAGFDFYNPHSLQFDGTDDYVNLGSSNILNISTNLSISTWLRLPSGVAVDGIGAIAWGQDSAGKRRSLILWNGGSGNNKVYWSGYGASSNLGGTTALLANTWYHTTVTVDQNSQARVYVNGIQENAGGVTLNSFIYSGTYAGATPLVGDGINENFSGLLDDVRIYNRALSASEVAALAAGNPNTGSGVYVLGSALNLSGDLNIQSGEIRTGNAYPVTLSGSFANHAQFTSTGTVTMDGTNQTISGSTIFKNLTKTVTTADTLNLDFRARQSVSGALTLQGVSGQALSLRSTKTGSGARILLDGDSGTQTLGYLNVKDSNATGGAMLIGGLTSTDSGNNTNWEFGSKITGTVYSDEGVTPITSGTVAVSINGGTKATDSVDGGGMYTVTGLTLTGGSIVTVFMDDNAADAVTVTRGSGSSMTGVHLYQNHLIIRSNTGSSANAPALTNTNLNLADNSGDSDIAAIYAMADSNTTLQLASGKELYVWTGSQYTPGGRVKSHDLEVLGTMAMATNGLTLSGSFVASEGTFTTSSGVILSAVEGDTAAPESLNLGTNSLNSLTINNGLVGYWKLDDGSGSLIARDDSGNGNHGTWNGAASGNTKPQWKTDTAAGFDFYNPHSLQFDGTDDYVGVGNSLNITSAMSLGVWVKLGSLANIQVIAGRSSSDAQNQTYKLQINTNGSIRVAHANANNFNNFDSSVGTISTGLWYHLAFKRDDGSASPGYKLWVNGNEQALTDTSGNTGVPNVNVGTAIGRLGDFNSTYVNGLLDDVRIYNRALSASEVAALAAGNPNTGSGVYVLGSALSLSGKLEVVSGELRTGNGESITLSGSWVNHGDFTSTGDVIFDGTNQTISGSTAFHNLTVNRATSDQLTIDYRSQQSVSGSLILNGAAGELLSLRSTKTGSAANLLLDGSSGTQSISYVDVKDNDATGGATLNAGYFSTNSGDNTNWSFPVQPNLYGHVFSDEGVTPLASQTVSLSINGAADAKSVETDASGAFSFTGVTIAAGNVLTVYLEDETADAVTVTVASGATAMTGVNLFQNRLITRHETGGTLTSTHLDTANNVNDADINGIYTMSSLNVTLPASKELFVWTGSTLALGGNLTVGTGGAEVRGTLNLGGASVSVEGNWTVAGTTVPGTSTVSFSNTLTISGSHILQNVSFLNDYVKTISSGTLTVVGTLNLPGNAVNNTINGPGVIAAQGNISVGPDYTTRGNAQLLINGENAQTFTGRSGGHIYLPIIINKPSSALTLSGSINTHGDWEYVQGSIVPGTSTVAFWSGTKTISGSHILGNVTFINDGVNTIETNTTLTVSGALTIINGNNTINSGKIDAKGNINFSNGSAYAHGTTALNIVGNGNQLMESDTNGSLGIPLTINKTDGTLSLSGTLKVYSDWNYLDGELVPGISTVKFMSGTKTISGSHALGNVTFANDGINNLTPNTVLTVRGTLSQENLSTTINTGIVAAQGDVDIANTSNIQGSARLLINGTGSQTILSNGGTYRLSPISIAKPSGTLRLVGNASFNTSGQDLALSGGTLNLNGYNLTVADQFVVGTGTTLRLHGDETITGGPDKVYANSTIWYDAPSGEKTLKTFPHKNVVIGSTGSAVYSLPSSFSVGGNLTISGGTLSAGANMLTLSGSFLETTGTFTAGTSTLKLAGMGDAAESSQLTAHSSLNNLTLNNGLVGYWKLDDGSGSLIARDDSGNGNHGTWNGAAGGNNRYPQWKTDTATGFDFYNPHSLQFDGTDDYVIASVEQPSVVTMSAWMNVRAYPISLLAPAVSFSTGGQGATSYSPYLGINSSRKLLATCYDGGVKTASSLADANLDTWYHIAGVYKDSSYVTLYINGVYQAQTATNTLYKANNSLVLSFSKVTENKYFSGLLDDVRIYNRGLSASEVQALASGNPNTGSGVYTLGSALSLSGELRVVSGELRTGNGENISVAGNWSNHGGFTSTGTVTLNAADGVMQTVSGSTVFKNFTKMVTAASTLFFDHRARQSFSGSLNLMGVEGGLLSLRSTKTGSSANLLLDGSSGSQNLMYLDVKDNDASNGQTFNADLASVNSGNNTNWYFPVIPDLYGHVYSDEGVTPLASQTVSLSINGAADAKSVETDASGAYAFTGVTIAAGNVLTVYIEDETADAVTVTVASGATAMTGVNLFQNRLITRHETGGVLTSTHLDTANNVGDTDINAIYTMSSLNTTIVNGKTLYIWTGSTLNLGGTLNVGTSGATSELHLNGSLTQNDYAITTWGPYTQSGGTFTGSSGGSDMTVYAFTLDDGIFTAPSGMMTIANTSTSNTTIFNHGAGTFNHNGGTLRFRSWIWEHTAPTHTINLNGNSLNVNNLIYTGGNSYPLPWYSDILYYSINGTFVVTGDLTLQEDVGVNIKMKMNNGTIDAKGNVMINAQIQGGTTVVKLNGTEDQEYTYTGGTAPYIEIDKDSGNVLHATGTTDIAMQRFTLTKGTFTAPSGTMTIANTSTSNTTIFTYTAGIFNHNNGTLRFRSWIWEHTAPTHTINLNGNSLDVNNLKYTGGNSYPLPWYSDILYYSLSGTFVVAGDLILQEDVGVDIKMHVNGGTNYVKGNVTINTQIQGGTASLTLSGTGNQIINHAGGTPPGGAWKLAKPSGTATLSGSLSLNTTNQDLTMTGGTLNLNGFNLTVADQFVVGTGTTLRLHGDETITGGPDKVYANSTIWYDAPSGEKTLKTFPHKNVVIGSTGSAVYSLPSSFSVGGNLTISGGTLSAGANTLTLSGSFIESTGTFDAGTSTLKLASTLNSQLSTLNSLHNLTINNGLVGYWKLDDGSGSLIARDDSGNGNHGTLVGANGLPTWSGSTANTNFFNPYSMQFDGTDDMVILGSPAANSNSLTISTWVKMDGDGSNGNSIIGVGDKDSDDNRSYIRLGECTAKLTNESVCLARKSGGTVNRIVGVTTDRSTVFDGGWHQITTVLNDAYFFYIDGVLKTTTTGDGYPTNDGLWAVNNYDRTVLGAYGPAAAATSDFNGLLDDVRIYNRALSASEVAALAAGNPSTGSGVYVLGSALTLSGDMGLRTGGLRTSNGEDIAVAGNWSNYGGFTSTGTVTLNAADGVMQTVSGSTVFKNFTKMVTAASTLLLDYRTRQSFSGSLNLMGVEGGLLSLRSTKTGSSANLLLDGDSGTQNLMYLDVKDSDASGGLELDGSDGGVDSGNTTNWFFDATPPSLQSFTSQTANGTYTIGAAIEIIATYDETLAAGSTLTVMLDTGRSMTLGTRQGMTMSGTYTVQMGDNSLDLLVDSITSQNVLDAVGNARTSTILPMTNIDDGSAIVIDTSTPAAPGTPDLVAGSDTGSSSTDNITSDTTPTFAISCETDALVRLLSGSTVIANGTCGAGTISLTPSTLNDQTYSLTAEQEDAAGNVSDASIPLSLVIDSMQPSMQESTAVPGLTNDSTPDYVFTVSETGSIVYAGACTSATTSATMGANSITFNELSDGTYGDCLLRVTDTAGNASAWLSVRSFTIDATDPVLAEVTSVPDPTQDATPDYTFSSTETGAISYGGACASSAEEAIIGENTITFASLADGIHNDCTITVMDSAGNASNVLAVTAFTVDARISISGTVWNDANGNSVHEESESEGFTDLSVTLGGTTSTGLTLALQDFTTSTGAYAFTQIGRSDSSGYLVSLSDDDHPAGYLSTTVTSSGGITATSTFDIGFLAPSTLTGAVFFDTNANNIRDAGENSIFSGALLSLTGVTGTGETLTRSILTNASGAYLFDQLPTSATSFLLVLTPPTGYEPTMSASRSITITTGGTLMMEDIGLVLPAVPSEEEDAPGQGQGPGGRRGKGPPIIVQIPGPPAITPPGIIPGTPPVTPGPIATIPDAATSDGGIPGVYLPPEIPDNIYPETDAPDASSEDVEEGPSFSERMADRIANTTHAAGSLLLELLSDIQEAGNQTAQTIAALGNETATVIADAVTGIGQGITTIASFTANAIDAGVQSVIAGIQSVGQTVIATLQSARNTTIAVLQGTSNVMDSTASSIAQALVSAVESTGNAIASSVDALGNAVYESASSSALALRSLGVESVADTVEFAGLLTNRALTVASVGIGNLWQAGQDTVQVAINRRIDTTVRPAVIVAGALQDAIGTFAVNTMTIARTMTGNIGAIGELALLRTSQRTELAGDRASDFITALWLDADQTIQIASERTERIGEQADNFRIALWSGIDRTQRSAVQIARNLRPAPSTEEAEEPAPETQHAAAPRTYRTSLQPKEKRFLLASLHLSITDNWNVPLANTPVVLFSTPKVAVTDEEGIATFHDVETGEHNLEIHLPSGAVETRSLIVEPPSGLQPEEIDVPFDVVLPVMQVKIDESLHASAETPAWLLPVVAIISLLAFSNTVLLGLYMRRRKS